MNSRTQTNKKEQNFHLLPTKRATIQEPKIKKTKRLKNTHINLKETPQQQHKHSEWKSDGPDGQSDNKTRKKKQTKPQISLSLSIKEGFSLKESKPISKEKVYKWKKDSHCHHTNFFFLFFSCFFIAEILTHKNQKTTRQIAASQFQFISLLC